MSRPPAPLTLKRTLVRPGMLLKCRLRSRGPGMGDVGGCAQVLSCRVILCSGCEDEGARKVQCDLGSHDLLATWSRSPL